MPDEPNSVVDLIEGQALRYPSATAISSADASLTYAELIAASRRLAAFLQTRGVKAGDIVPILTSRCLEMAICVLAVAQLGTAWAPMELETWSHGRIQAVLATLEHKIVLITADKNKHEIANAILGAEIRQATSGKRGDTPAADEPPIRSIATPAHTAYIIFTSGTTGVPKGVVIKHESLLNYVWSTHENAPFNLGATPTDTSLLLFSVAFDGKYQSWHQKLEKTI